MFLAEMSVHVGMATENELRAAIDQLAQRIQVLHLLSSQLRREAGRSAERAVELEGQVAACVRILKALQPKENG